MSGDMNIAEYLREQKDQTLVSLADFIEERTEKIIRLEKIIALLEKSNEYYSDENNWEKIDVFGGKLARKIKKKVKELRSEKQDT